jgi:hypothetical protein
LAGVVGSWVHAHRGIPDRMTAYLQAADEFAWPPSDNYTPDCLADLLPKTNANYCLRARADKAPDVAILGDSHANMYYPGLKDYYAARGLSLFNSGKGGCSPFSNLSGQGRAEDFARGLAPGPQCTSILTDIVDYVVREKAIKTVLLTSRNPYDGEQLTAEAERTILEGIMSGTPPQKPNFVDLYVEAMRKTIARLEENGKQVVFLLDIPMMPFDPKSCVKLRPYRLFADKPRVPCAVSRKKFDDRSAVYRETMLYVLKQFPSAKVFDPAKVLCDAAWCEAMRDGKVLYRDPEHFSEYGSAYVAQHFAVE